jgi:DNA recombination protein RmuC
MTTDTIIVLAASGAVLLVTVATAILLVRRAGKEPAVSVPAELAGAVERLAGTIEGRTGALAEAQEATRRAVEGLYASSGKRGRWGELTLRRLLESAGLVLGTDFDEQVHVAGDAIPDVVVHLGRAGEVVVDAKAPMDGLRRADEAADDAARSAALKDHALAVKRHAADLARRDYPSKMQAEFVPVVMFLPAEGAWEAAERGRPDIVAEVLGMGVYPASPANLGLVVELLRHQALTLDQDRTAAAIVEEARKLVGNVGTHVEHLAKLGRGLVAAVGAYNKTLGNLERRTLPAARRIAEMTPGNGQVAALETIEDAPAVERCEAMGPEGEAA